MNFPTTLAFSLQSPALVSLLLPKKFSPEPEFLKRHREKCLMS
jgi:hypothetical protein